MAKILQIGMIPHNMTLFKFICVPYQFHGQTLPIMKIDRAKSNFETMRLQERNHKYSSTYNSYTCVDARGLLFIDLV